MTSESGMPYRFVLIGNSGVGKSTIIRRYILGNEISDETQPTIGAAFYVIPSAGSLSNRKIQIWDTAGQERFRSMCPIYYRGSSGCICVFSVIDRESFDAVDQWINSYKHESKSSLVLLIANKIDAPENKWKMSKNEINTLAQIHNCEFVYTCAKNYYVDDICRYSGINLNDFNNKMESLYDKIFQDEMHKSIINLEYDEPYKEKTCDC
jgi:small GTP-binding protein